MSMVIGHEYWEAQHAKKAREARREAFWRRFVIAVAKWASVLIGLVGGWCVAEQIKLMGAILGSL